MTMVLWIHIWDAKKTGSGIQKIKSGVDPDRIIKEEEEKSSAD
jgi:hypothetical protein